MNQYSVLLVDDEEEVFQVMMKKLDWESMGFKIIGYAKNGVEALELANELQPDVVMTDIKMPYMDGLTLCKKLKESYNRVRVIIFSGFDEFEYAKEAIKIEAEEYILKPINANELREVFERIKNSLDKELDEKRNVDKLKEYYMESLPVLQENFYTSLIEGRIPEKQIDKYLTNYQIKLHAPYYVATILHVSSEENTSMENGEMTEGEKMDPFLLLISLKKYVEEQFAGLWESKIISYLGNLVVITQLQRIDEITKYTDDCDKICKLINRVFHAKVTAGIGHLCDQINELQLSYQGAQNAISYRVLYGNVRAINIAEIDPQENVDIPWEESHIATIFKKIKMGEQGALEQAIADFINQLTISRISLPKYKILIMEFIAEIYKFGNDNQIHMELVFPTDRDVYGQALGLESPEALGEWLQVVCGKLQEQVLHDRQDTTKSFVTNAMAYVKEHYADKELSIETICSYLNVSSAYFSTIFKKETGKTFINYLTDYRMEQAVEMLNTTDEKTYIIADQVGYSDANYFSYVFKKQFGVSPSKYRVKDK